MVTISKKEPEKLELNYNLKEVRQKVKISNRDKGLLIHLINCQDGHEITFYIYLLVPIFWVIFLKYKTHTHTHTLQVLWKSGCLPSCLYPRKVFEKANRLLANTNHHDCSQDKYNLSCIQNKTFKVLLLI